MYVFGNTAAIVLLGVAMLSGPPDHSPRQAPQPTAEAATVKTPDSGTWMPMPDLMPKGAEMQVLNGDPAKGPADFYFKVPANYTFPWHFHTPVEKLFAQQGTLRFEMRGNKTEMVDAGEFVYVPARSPHRVTCTSTRECLFFLSSTGPFDIHVVDENTWKTTKSWRAADQMTSAGRNP